MVQVDDKLILITLLVELGVAAAVCGDPGAVDYVSRICCCTQHRSLRQTVELLAMICVPLTLGVWIRVMVPNFLAADLSFEATILLGLLLGPAGGDDGWGVPGDCRRCCTTSTGRCR